MGGMRSGGCRKSVGGMDMGGAGLQGSVSPTHVNIGSITTPHTCKLMEFAPVGRTPHLHVWGYRDSVPPAHESNIHLCGVCYRKGSQACGQAD